MTKKSTKKKKRKKNQTLSNKASHPHSCFPSRSRSPGAKAGPGQGRADRGLRSRTPRLASSSDHSSWCRGTGRMGVVGAAGRPKGTRPPSLAAATTLTFVCSFAFFSLQTRSLAQRPWSAPPSREHFSQEAMEWVGAGRGAGGTGGGPGVGGRGGFSHRCVVFFESAITWYFEDPACGQDPPWKAGAPGCGGVWRGGVSVL